MRGERRELSPEPCAAAAHTGASGKIAAHIVEAMPSLLSPSSVLPAPPRLVAASRVDFRCAALDALQRAADEGTNVLAIDMARTAEVDASGLGILVLVQKRARERGLATRLLGVRGEVRALLALTKLEGLFAYE